MKRFLCFILLCSGVVCRAAIIAWDGGAGNGLWNTAANWSGDILPGATDDVVLDNLFVTGSYAVSLPDGNITTTIHSLTINPALGESITVNLPPSNTANPGINLTAGGDALIINNRGVFKNSSRVAVAGSSGVVLAGNLRINNGGRYVHNTTSRVVGLVAALSVLPGTENGVFEYDVPTSSYTVSLSNRAYGTLEFSATANGGVASYTGTGSNPLLINGNLQINTGAAFKMSMTGDCIIRGHCIQSPSAVWDLQTLTGSNFIRIQGNILSAGTITESGNGFPVIELNGLVNQEIAITGSLLNSIELKINNPAGCALTAPLTLPYKLQLANGKIKTGLINILAMNDNAVYSGGSAASFIEGPLKKTGDEDFVFPVGKGQIYAPVGLMGTTGVSATDEFTVEYMRSNPQTIAGTNYETGTPPNIDHISYVEYWNVQSNTGNAVFKSISLKVNCESFCKGFGNLFIASYNKSAGLWENKRQSGISVLSPCAGYLSGVVSAGPVNDFSFFTLATSETFSVNPLPVHLISFNVWRNPGGRTMISWEPAIDCNQADQFEVQRADEDHFFKTVTVVKGHENRHLYSLDLDIDRQTAYYRLKWTDAGGASICSRIVMLPVESQDLSLFLLSPGILSSEARFSVVSTGERGLILLVMDMVGRVRRRQYRLLAGNTTITLETGSLPAGIYQVYGIMNGAKTNTVRFVKE